MTKSFTDYMARAQSLLDAGFSTKQAQKDANDYVGRAFDMARDALHHEMSASLPGGYMTMSDTTRAVYDSIPFSAAHWNAKRRQLLAADSRWNGDLLARLDQCAELRAKIVAAPVVKRPPQRTAKQIAEDAMKRTCQICGRPIFAETGVIAHHGYQRPGEGWQTESCSGARELPFEADRLILLGHIRHQKSILSDMENSRTAVAFECQPVALSYEVARKINGKSVYYRGQQLMDTIAFTVTRETFDEIKSAHPKYFKVGYDSRSNFDALLTTDLHARDARIKNQAQYVTWQEGRADAWVQKEQWNIEAQKWEAK